MKKKINETVYGVADRPLEFGININIDENDWMELILSGSKTIETRSASTYKQWSRLVGQYVGLVQTTSRPKKNNPTGILKGYAKIERVIPYHDANEFNMDKMYHKVDNGSDYSWENNKRIGLLLGDVHRLDDKQQIKLKSDGQRAVRRLMTESELYSLLKESILMAIKKRYR